MTHAELSKVLATALRDCLNAMNNPSMAGDPEKAYRAARIALSQYDSTSQPARRNRREAQRARLCVAAMAGLDDAQVFAVGKRIQSMMANQDLTRRDPESAALFDPSKRWPRAKTGD